ncbi:MAG: hypothetical protein IPM92_10895 [Saprospiraceae bacterium]|nr:hypothetical protein [Saprospiraceae bacterium]
MKNNIAWIYLFIAALMEMLWMISLKFMSVKAIKQIVWSQFFMHVDGIKTLWPLLGYLVFGLLNVVFISYAMKTIPMSIAFAVWMALALFGSACVDAFIFKQHLNVIQLICLGLILVGVIGLKTAKS